VRIFTQFRTENHLAFVRDFRILDTASELAFLALECERLGAQQVGDWILKTYSD
jgi:hypothetical protein